MAGITILNTSEYLVRRIGGGMSFNVILFSFFTLLLLAMFVISIIVEDDQNGPLFMGILITGALTIGFWRLNGIEVTIPQYQVVIDESVSYTVFTDKYKVLKQEGRIYTIIDKEELAKAEKK